MALFHTDYKHHMVCVLKNTSTSKWNCLLFLLTSPPEKAHKDTQNTQNIFKPGVVAQPVISALRGLRHEHCVKFKTSLGCRVRLCSI